MAMPEGGHHLNVNVFTKDTLLDAQASEVAQLTIRTSGYAVKFQLPYQEQQDDVISRTFHDAL